MGIGRVGQNRILTPYITVNSVILLPKIPCIHVYIWFWPTQGVEQVFMRVCVARVVRPYAMYQFVCLIVSVQVCTHMCGDRLLDCFKYSACSALPRFVMPKVVGHTTLKACASAG
jgi:hypothetical protein